MTILGELLGFESRATASSGVHPSVAGGWWEPRESATGIDVSERSSLSNAAVYQAVLLIAGSKATLPFILYEREAGGGRRRAMEHRLFRTLHDQPNPEGTWVTFCQSQTLNKLLWGNSYAEIELNNAGEAVRLWHLPSDIVAPERWYAKPGGGLTRVPGEAAPEDRRRGGTILYKVKAQGGDVWIPPERMFHVPDLSVGGVKGFSRISQALESVALGLASLQQAASTFGNSSLPGGVIERPEAAPPLSPKGQQNLKAAWEATHGGPKRSGRVAILQEGMQFKPVSMSPVDAQLLETRQLQILEVAQIFNLSPYWLGHPGASNTYSNIEAERDAFLTRTLLVHLRADEQEVARKLLTPDERNRYFAEYETKGFLRGDSAARSTFYKAMIEMGAMTTGQVADAENLPPVPDDQGGATYWKPLNIAPAAAQIASAEPAPRSEPTGRLERRARQERSVDARRRLRSAFAPLIQDGAARVIGREVARIGQQLGPLDTNPEAWMDWMGDFYADHRDFVLTVMGPVLSSYFEAAAREAADEVGIIFDAVEDQVGRAAVGYRTTYASALVRRHAAQLAQLLREREDAVEAVKERLERWQDTGPAREALFQVVRTESAASQSVYRAGGFRRKRWVTAGACPLCQQFDGRVVEIEHDFAGPGDTIEAEGRPTLELKRLIEGPPLHEGCDCSVVAE